MLPIGLMSFCTWLSSLNKHKPLAPTTKTVYIHNVHILLNMHRHYEVMNTDIIPRIELHSHTMSHVLEFSHRLRVCNIHVHKNNT
jgi:hypothetical protein